MATSKHEDLFGPRAEHYQKIISGLARPGWMRNASPLDDFWIAETEDPTKTRNTQKRVEFRTIVAPGCKLTDLPADLTTAKLLVYYSMTSTDGRNRSAANLPILARNYAQFVRWRLGRGIDRNCDLTAEDFLDLLQTVRDHGVLDLAPVRARAERMMTAVRAGEAELPLSPSGRNDGRSHMSLRKVAQALGVQDEMSLPASLRSQLYGFADEMGVGPARRGNPDAVSEQSLTASRVAGFLRSIALLYGMRRRMDHDPIAVEPFPASATARSLANEIAQDEDGRTFTVPPAQACHLIDQALRWVLEYADDLKAFAVHFSKQLEDWTAAPPSSRSRNKLFADWQPRSGLGELGSPWPLHPSYHRAPRSASSQPSLRVALFDHLAVACMIVIAAFSARRRNEIASLKAGCVVADDDGDYWLDVFIEKTIRDMDKIPVPASVAKAVSVLEWLSSVYRERSTEEWIFEFDDLCLPPWAAAGNRPIFSVYRSLQRFAEHVGVPPLDDGTVWSPKPHEFRRFFGVVYYNYYRFPHLTALSSFYRHFDPDMTRRYVAEAAKGAFLTLREDQRAADRRAAAHQHQQRLRDFEDAGQQFRVERYSEILDGTTPARGFGGEALTRELYALVQEAKLRLDLSPDDALPRSTLSQLLQEFAGEQRLEPNSLGHSACRCRNHPVDLSAAVCRQRSNGKPFPSQTALESVEFGLPNPAEAADQHCSACPHNVQFPEHGEYWRRRLEHEKSQARCALGPLLAALSSERSRMVEAHLRRWHPNEEDPT